MPTQKTICVFAPVHPHRDIRVFQKEARSLAKAGYRVLLLAHGDESVTEDGVELSPLRYSSRWQRFLLQPVFLWKILLTGADAAHIHNPDTLFVGCALRMLGKKVVYDTHENFRMLIPTRTWVPGPLKRPLATMVDLMERFAGRVFDNVVVTQFSQQERIGFRSVLIENAPITEGKLIDKAFEIAKHHERGDYLRVVYPGLLNEERGLFSMIEAMEVLNRTTRARLWLMGLEGDSTVIPRAKKLPGWRYVDYLGLQEQANAFSYMVAADVGLVTFLPKADNEVLNPNKLFEYQRFATPFVASNFKVWRSYQKEIDAGLWVDPTSVEEIAKALQWIAEHPKEAKKLGERGQKFVLEEYNWEKESQKLLQIYERLLG
ncbi:MAG: glycosyltransferase family 4 protein [Deltaproteobacteria bacterium]|nr:glycosyltransferase family 4 protein [Deltaproteobacteria bacterium]